jgi:hypothetical protein
MCDITDWKQGALLSCILLLEAWLGRTDKTKYSSTLEFMLLGAVDILKSLLRKKKE